MGLRPVPVCVSGLEKGGACTKKRCSLPLTLAMQAEHRTVIAEANGLSDPYRIHIGQVLEIPAA